MIERGKDETKEKSNNGAKNKGVEKEACDLLEIAKKNEGTKEMIS